MSREPSIVVTVDTEGDDEWQFRRTPGSENIRSLPPFEAMLGRLGIRATYLVTQTVAENPEAAAALRDLHETRGAEIGAHCHAWSTTPIAEPEGAQLFLNELPEQVQRAKLGTLTETIERRIGVRPVSFRGGRFGADVATMRCLTNLGYEVDSSVTPGISWRRTPGLPGGAGGPDYRTAPVHTYFQDPDDLCRPGRGRLFEIPVTVVRSRRLPGPLAHAIAGFGPAGLVSAVAGKLGLGRPLWFYAAFQTADEMVEAAETCRAQGGDVFNMMLHSSELMPGGSPYFGSQDQVKAFLGRMERALEMVMDRTGAVPRTLREVPRGEGAAMLLGGVPC